MLPKLKKIILSVLCGGAILIITWKYQNYDYTLKLEDEFFKKVFLFRDKIYDPLPKHRPEFVFINTGKDLALVEDTIDYGNIAISDRQKISRLLHHINGTNKKPVFCVLDIQFYYPYSDDPETDAAMQTELKKIDNIVIPILKDRSGKYKEPLYATQYAHSDYRTFSTTFNKFRILIQEKIKSIPIVMHEQINGARYEDNFIYPTCNNNLCLTAIWPSYFITEATLKKSTNITDPGQIASSPASSTKGSIKAIYYNIGELLFDLDADSTNQSTAFANKIVIVGNFQEDVHVTPIGKISGPILLANIYLSLLNQEHIVSFWLLMLMLTSFSGLSYVALFNKMPEINITFKFLFSSYLTKFIRNYISYFGAMFLVSLIALIFFNVQVALFLPSAIFSGIEWLKEKKYLDLKK